MDFSSRKFLLTVGVIILAFVLVLVGKVTSDVFLGFVQTVGAVYLGANVVESVGTAFATKK